MYEEHRLEIGDVIHTSLGEPIKIVKFLAAGGQGEVYVVEYNGKKKALKWYTNAGKNPQAFYKNLKDNVEKGSPDSCFLWPLAVTEQTKGSFGYIMDLVQSDYYTITKYLLRKVKFANFKVVIDTCLEIVAAYRILHNLGYSYQDLNDGNFFINPKNGKVLIGDCDNVAPNGTNMGVIGKDRYMAPELVKGRGKVLPDTHTDQFSMSVILFMILCMNHPLEGKNAVSACMVDANTIALYGTHATFIFDPTDKSNEAVKNVHVNAIRLWSLLPDYVREMFEKAFSKQVLQEPNRRIPDVEWQDVLVRFRSDIVDCNCGCEVFMQNASSTKCDKCGKLIEVHNQLKLQHYAMPALAGTRLYRCQLGTCNYDEALNPVAMVAAKKDNPNVLGIVNMSTQTWKGTTTTGTSKNVSPKEVVPIKSGIKIEVFGRRFEII